MLGCTLGGNYGARMHHCSHCYSNAIGICASVPSYHKASLLLLSNHRQMGITGMPWCNFYVHTESDYHLERISFDKDFRAVMKNKLDLFFYNYYLPLFVK